MCWNVVICFAFSDALPRRAWENTWIDFYIRTVSQSKSIQTGQYSHETRNSQLCSSSDISKTWEEVLRCVNTVGIAIGVSSLSHVWRNKFASIFTLKVHFLQFYTHTVAMVVVCWAERCQNSGDMATLYLNASCVERCSASVLLMRHLSHIQYKQLYQQLKKSILLVFNKPTS